MKKWHFQIIPIYGFAIGLLYYNPNLEPNQNQIVDDENYYEQITIMLVLIGLHITIWKE